MKRAIERFTCGSESSDGTPATGLESPAAMNSGAARIPERPLFRDSATCASSLPMQETMPMPVTTTRRFKLQPPEHERGVDAAEGEVVLHRVPDVEPAALAGDVVEAVALRVGGLEVERRREPAAVHHLDQPPRLHRAAGAERVADVALHRADRHRGAEHLARGARLGDVAAAGRGAR